MSERMEKKIDTILEKVHNIDLTLTSQHASLVHHIKRTDLLEAKVEPLEKHVTIVNGIFKAAIAASAIAASVLGVLKVIGKL
jgi:hypothetical protein